MLPVVKIPYRCIQAAIAYILNFLVFLGTCNCSPSPNAPRPIYYTPGIPTYVSSTSKHRNERENVYVSIYPESYFLQGIGVYFRQVKKKNVVAEVAYLYI